VRVRIKEMRREDFGVVHELRDAVYTGVSSEFHDAELAIILEAPDRECWVVYDGERAVGFVEATLRNAVDGCLTSPVGFIEGIYVRPEFRGRGLGARLVGVATEWSKQAGCTEMATDAEIENTDAQSFHKRMGFVETYRIVEFKKTIE